MVNVYVPEGFQSSPAEPVSPTPAGAPGDDGVSLLGVGSFLAFLTLAAFSRPFLNAINVATDLLPVVGDIRTLLGVKDEETIDWSVALPGILSLLVAVGLALCHPAILAGLYSSGDIAPYLSDVRNTLRGYVPRPGRAAPQ